MSSRGKAHTPIVSGDLHRHFLKDTVSRSCVFSEVKSCGDDDFEIQINDFRLTDVKGNVVKDVIAG
jgi:hypothetical protein